MSHPTLPSTPDPSPDVLTRLVKARAFELGFSVCGVARADVPLDVEFARYEAALGEGLHGSIDYLARNVEVRRRLDTDDILAGARSVIVVGARYDAPDVETVNGAPPSLVDSIARYARGRDYHVHLRKRLRRLADFVRTAAPGVAARPMSDTAPVLERAWAMRAGVGFVGKNGLIIVPGQGSWLLLGEVVTTAVLEADAPMIERCGSCTLCIDACPTRAIVRPFVIDAGRCIAALTIELRGPIPEAFREEASAHLFGCDICQDVCPHNGKSRAPGPLAERYMPHPRWASLTLDDLARIGMSDGPSFDDVAHGSPLFRAGSEGLARNACLMLGHLRRVDSEALLVAIASSHPSDVVRDAARWSLDRIVRRRVRCGNDL